MGGGRGGKRWWALVGTGGGHWWALVGFGGPWWALMEGHAGWWWRSRGGRWWRAVVGGSEGLWWAAVEAGLSIRFVLAATPSTEIGHATERSLFRRPLRTRRFVKNLPQEARVMNDECIAKGDESGDLGKGRISCDRAILQTMVALL